MNHEILQLIEKEFDAERVLRAVSAIVETDRLFTFPAFHRTSRTAAALMRRAGLKQVEIHSFPADGETVYGDWTVPTAWDVRDARLWIKEKTAYRKVADRGRNPCNVMMYSASTPEGKTVSCRLVGEKNKKAWRGNLVFAEGSRRLSPRMLAEGGALGIVTDYFPLWPHCRTRRDVYDCALWNNSYFAPRNEHGLVGFQVTPREGDRIRAALERAGGSLPCRVVVDAELYRGHLDFVTGVLPGEDDSGEEVAVFAHLFEPGANDNASGCATAVEALRVIGSLRRKGRIPPLRRSLRLCFTFEIFGTLAFFERHPDRMRRIVAGVNPDMVGPDMEKCRSRLHVHGTPDSACSWVDALMTWYIEREFEANYLLRWSEKPFFINDNFVTDPAIGIPSPALVCLRDTYYHSSGDVVDNLSPDTIHAIGAALAGYLHAAAAGGRETSFRLVERVLAREVRALDEELAVAEGVPLDEFAAYRVETAARRLGSVRGFLRGGRGRVTLRRRIEDAVRAFRAYAEARVKMKAGGRISSEWRTVLNPPRDTVHRAARLVPMKKFLGTAASCVWEGKKAEGTEWSYRMNAPLFWADGRRSVYEIWRNWCWEFRAPCALEHVLSYFEDFRERGLVEVRERK